jgi:hypothetical protein
MESGCCELAFCDGNDQPCCEFIPLRSRVCFSLDEETPGSDSGSEKQLKAQRKSIGEAVALEAAGEEGMGRVWTASSGSARLCWGRRDISGVMQLS